MLVEKFNKGDVIVLKLTSSEEIIATHNTEDNTNIYITAPNQLVLTQVEKGSQGYLSFAPWMVGLDDNAQVKIPKSAVITRAPARHEAKYQYQRIHNKSPTGDGHSENRIIT